MRDHELAAQLQAMPDDELTDTRRDLHAGLGLIRPQSPMYAPARAYIDAITAELARRAGQQTDGLPGSPRA